MLLVGVLIGCFHLFLRAFALSALFKICSHLFFYHLQSNEGERQPLRRIMDRETTTTTRSALLNDTVGPGRGAVADYFVMDLGTAADIMLRASIDTAGPNIDNKNAFPCLFCARNNNQFCLSMFYLLCFLLANCSDWPAAV